MENHPKVTVLFFGKIPPPYIGPAVATQKIINSKLKDQFNLVLFDISHHKSIDDLGKYNFSNVTSAMGQYWRLIKEIRRVKPDIVYMPSQQTTIAYLRDIPFWMIVKLSGRKLICHLRGGYFRKWYENETPGWMKFLVRFWQKRIDAQIVLGDNLIQMYEPVMPRERIYVVPNAGDYDIPAVERAKDEKIKVLYLGNFIETKGVLDTLSAYHELNEETQRKVEFLFAGNWHEPETKQKMEELAAKAAPNKIQFLGPVAGEDKFRLLASCDIMVFPTFYRNEGHPWVLVESIAAGLAVISTDHAAVSQTVIDGFNGFLVAKNNPAEIARKVEELVANPELMETMKGNSSDLYQREFKEANNVANFAKVFNAIASK